MPTTTSSSTAATLHSRSTSRSGTSMHDSEQNRELPTVDEVSVDHLDRKLLDVFAGRVVRKDLVKKLKVGFNVPVYVLEYLLGKFCSTTNRDEIDAGLRQVKETITER